MSTYTTTAAAATAPTTATTASGGTAASALATLALTSGTRLVLVVRLGLASKLDGDLALQDLLPAELVDGPLGLARGRQVNKGVADRLVRARVLRDRDGLPRSQIRLAADADSGRAHVHPSPCFDDGRCDMKSRSFSTCRIDKAPRLQCFITGKSPSRCHEQHHDGQGANEVDAPAQ